MLDKKALWILFIIFLLVSIIAYYTPMQSDDFHFYLSGLSLSNHFDSYMTWSGRVVADFVSPLILLLEYRFLVAFVNSLAVPLLIYTIATLPYYQESQKKASFAFTLFVVFVCYWLGNPALGQTTFWVVGAANYLWTSVFAALYLKYLLHIVHRPSVTVKDYVFILLLAFLAGCSNEATGALTVYFTAMLLLLSWFKQFPYQHKKLLILSALVLLFGFAVLVLAPGNMVRAAHPAFAAWRAIPLDVRIKQHFMTTAPNILKSYGVIYAVLLWALAQGIKDQAKKDKLIIILSLSTVLVFAVIEIASPHAMLARTYSAGLLFLLIAVSFALKGAFTEKVSYLGKSLFICFFIVFGFSYVSMFVAYQSLYRQSELRISILQKQKYQGKTEGLIPSYFEPFVLRQGDLPEISHHNPFAMGRYYGLQKVKMTYIDFDYEKILHQPCMIPPDMKQQASSIVSCFYYDQSLFSNEITWIVQFNEQVAALSLLQNRFTLKVENSFDPSSENYYKITLPLRIVKIGEKYFASIKVVKNLLSPSDDGHEHIFLELLDKQEEFLPISGSVLI